MKRLVLAASRRGGVWTVQVGIEDQADVNADLDAVAALGRIQERIEEAERRIAEADRAEREAFARGYVAGVRDRLSGEAAHQVVKSWSGTAGECGVECACGKVLDNFDTTAEARLELEAHIGAEAESRHDAVQTVAQ